MVDVEGYEQIILHLDLQRRMVEEPSGGKLYYGYMPILDQTNPATIF